MLQQENRLKKDKDFQRVYKFGRPIFTHGLGIKYAPNQLKNSRFGFVVSKKLHNKSTKRNQIKRQVREVFRLNIRRIKSGFDIIVVIRSLSIGRDFLELQKIVKNLLIRARLFG